MRAGEKKTLGIVHLMKGVFTVDLRSFHLHYDMITNHIGVTLSWCLYRIILHEK